MKKNYWRITLSTYIILYGVICFLTELYTNFNVSLNDFWGNLFMAEHLDIGRPESFFNGFYPLGYAVYLRIFSFGNPIIFASLTNIFFGLLLLGSISYFISKTLGYKWALLGTIILSILPLVFRYITLPGPDIGATAFITLGGILMILSTKKPDDRKSIKLFLYASALCGLSALWRYNLFVLAVGFIASISFFSRKPLRYMVAGFISFFSIYSIQIFFNILSGHGPLDTDSSFNVYKLVNGIDWQHVSELKGTIPSNILDVILSSPKRFLLEYDSAVQEFLLLFIPPILGVFLFKDKFFIRISVMLTASFFLYVLVVTMGISERAVIPMLPFAIYQIIVLSKFSYDSARGQLSAHRTEILSISGILVIVAMLYFSSFVIEDIETARWNKAENENYTEIENILLKEGTVKEAREVFATDFDLYFPNLISHHPYSNGDWERYDLFGYNEEFPELSTRNIEEFLRDCKENEIRCLILDMKYGLLTEELSQIYSEELKISSIKKIAEVNDYKIFKLEL